MKSRRPNRVFRSAEGRRQILEAYDSLLRRVPFAYKETRIPTSFGETYVLEAGAADAPPLILFHGSSSNCASWFGDIGELARRFRVMAVDTVGEAGHSAERRYDMHTDAYAQWIRELYAAVGVDKASLMGNSLGGWLCLDYATRFPASVDRIVLLASSGLATIRLPFLLQILFYSLRGKNGGAAIRRMVCGGDSLPDEVVAFMDLVAEHFLPYTGPVPIVSDEDLARLSMPLLYIAGAGDQVTNAPASAARLRRVLPNAKVHLLPDRGHVVADVLPLILPFLEGKAQQ